MGCSDAAARQQRRQQREPPPKQQCKRAGARQPAAALPPEPKRAARVPPNSVKAAMPTSMPSPNPVSTELPVLAQAAVPAPPAATEGGPQAAHGCSSSWAEPARPRSSLPGSPPAARASRDARQTSSAAGAARPTNCRASSTSQAVLHAPAWRGGSGRSCMGGLRGTPRGTQHPSGLALPGSTCQAPIPLLPAHLLPWRPAPLQGRSSTLPAAGPAGARAAPGTGPPAALPLALARRLLRSQRPAAPRSCPPARCRSF